jgi:hypothetical protein
MRRSTVAIFLLSASALIGCATTAPDDHSTGPRCEATVNGTETRTPVWYNISPRNDYFSITCTNPNDNSKVYASARYPLSVGTTSYLPDSLSALSGIYRSPQGVNYLTWGAGASGSITITAWDSTSGVVSGQFSFTANAESSDGSSVNLTVPPVVASVVFIDARIQP